ncbi:MAG: hypothetical protein AB3N63_04870 [Puniceicoccaceae bacterium]
MIYFIKVFKNVLLVFIGLFVVWQFWTFLAPHPDPLQAEELAAVHDACDEFIQVLGEKTGGAPLTFGMVRFQGDASGEVTAAAEAAIASQPAWTIDESPIVQRMVGDIAKAIADATSIDDVLKAGQSVSLDAVILGKVREVAILPEGSTATIEFHVRDLKNGGWLLQQSITGTWKPGLIDALRTPIPGWLRLLAWILIVAALPWITQPIIHKAVEAKSNQTSALLVGGYTLAAVILAALLMGFSLQGVGSWALFVAAVSGAGGYSWWACEQVAKE